VSAIGRSAFLHGLQRADAAWGVVYGQQADELQKSRESLRAADKDLGGMRAANERLRRELDQAIDRASEAEERVKQLTTAGRSRISASDSRGD
jgi:hypothetical protein